MKKLFLYALTLILVGCDYNYLRSDHLSDTLVYRGEDFEPMYVIPLAFERDTVFAELWFRTLNVDGDNKRFIRLFHGRDTSIFDLCNSVNNYTSLKAYALKGRQERLLWIEDNFGTSVYDIDKRKKVKIKHSNKLLDSTAGTGASIGLYKELNIRDMVSKLGRPKTYKLKILDSIGIGIIQKEEVPQSKISKLLQDQKHN